MSKKELNTAEFAKLRDGLYVASIIAKRINFTPEFNLEAYRLLIIGRTMRSIFEEHRIAPEILNGKSIWTLRTYLEHAPNAMNVLQIFEATISCINHPVE